MRRRRARRPLMRLGVRSLLFLRVGRFVRSRKIRLYKSQKRMGGNRYELLLVGIRRRLRVVVLKRLTLDRDVGL